MLLVGGSRPTAFNRFASYELCRSLQDGGKTPLTVQPAHSGDERSIQLCELSLDYVNLRPMHHNTQPHRAALAYARSRGSSSVCDKTNASMMRTTSLAC